MGRRRKDAPPPTPLTEERRALAERYIPLALGVAGPYMRRSPRRAQEYRSAALLGLVEAAAAYDPDQHANFHAYARRRIAWELHDARIAGRPLGFRRCGSPGPCPGIVGLRPDSEEEGRPFSSASPPLGALAEAVEECERLLGMATPRQAEALRAWARHGTCRAAAAELGVGEGRVSRMVAIGISNIRRRAAAWIGSRGAAC
jgi:hypothetical protein